jgi:hypothetical protein
MTDYVIAQLRWPGLVLGGRELSRDQARVVEGLLREMERRLREANLALLYLQNALAESHQAYIDAAGNRQAAAEVEAEAELTPELDAARSQGDVDLWDRISARVRPLATARLFEQGHIPAALLVCGPRMFEQAFVLGLDGVWRALDALAESGLVPAASEVLSGRPPDVPSGEHVEVEISAASLLAARDAIQVVIDALSWRGSLRYSL